MPRLLVKKFSRIIHARRHKWYLSIFGERLTDSHLWSLNRHSITAAFGVGIGVSFIPLPVHLLLVVLAAVYWRLNVAVAIAGSYFVNPFTMVPVYYGAYRVGALLLRYRPRHFVYHLSWNWLEHGLGPAWRPFLLGCLVCGILCGLLGRIILEIVWRAATMRRYHARRERHRAIREAAAAERSAGSHHEPGPHHASPPGSRPAPGSHTGSGSPTGTRSHEAPSAHR